MASTSGEADDRLEIANIIRLFKQGEAVDHVMKVIADSDPATLTEVKTDGTSLLHSFAMIGSYDIVKALWNKGARPSILQLDQSTILHSVVRTQDEAQDEGRSQMLQLFLSCEKHGSDLKAAVNLQNSKGWTTLKLAARRNLERCVEVLLDNGADPDIPDEENFTALHNAIGFPAIVKLLLTKAKKINSQNNDGETPLYLAAERGLTESALTLLEYGADPNIPNKEVISPLFLAARGGHLELVKALVRYGGEVNKLGAPQNIGPLHWAAHKEHVELALFLIENGADLLKQDGEGRTPLSMASPELADRMIAAAQKLHPELSLPNVSSVSLSAEEKAMAACCGGNIPALQALIQAGVSVNHTSGNTSSNLLHMAAYCGQLPVVMYLFSQGADWKAIDKDGDTLLHFACMKEVDHGMHDKTLDYLLSLPSVATLKDCQNVRGDTPLMVATRCGYVSRVKLLLIYKADTSIVNEKNELPLHRAASTDKNIEVLLHLAELAPSLDVADIDGWTPLLYAAKAQASTAVKYLLQRGADPNIAQSDGFTALYLAAQEDNPSICQMLLEAGADPSLSGGTQKLTPLHIAAHRNGRAVCLILIQYGADINQEDGDGDTPLMLAEGAELKQVMMMVAQSRTTSTSELHTSEQTCNDLSPSNSNANRSADSVSNEDVLSLNEEAPEDDESNKPPIHRQGTFSKEDEREEESREAVPLSRFVELEREMTLLTGTMADLRSELEALHDDKEMLLLRNQSLEEELQKQKVLVAIHHKHNAITLHHAHHHNMTCPHHHAWWLVDKSTYEVSGQVLNEGDASRGKFFDVYRGVYRNIPVAVRTVRKTEKWDEEIFRTFYNEVDFISQLQCPCLVQFIGACVDVDSRECVILNELMSRGSLDCVLHVDKIPLDWNTRLGIVRDVCCGMAFLHSHEVLHRSLIPHNILIGDHFNAKLSDFGLWKTKQKSDFFNELKSQCNAPQVYMAPEAMEHFQFTQAADVYSFGIIMCEAATGQKPFADLQLCQDRPVVLVMKLLMGLRPGFNGGVPKDYQKLAEKCWHADPNLRPAFKSICAELQNM